MRPSLNASTTPARSASRSRCLLALAALVLGIVAAGILLRRETSDTPSAHPPAILKNIASEHTPPAKNAAVLTLASDWDDRWQRWLARLSTPGNDAEFAAEFEALITLDPARALISALRETDPARRAGLVRAVLLVWAETDPSTAAAAARNLPETERADAVTAVLASAVGTPETAIRLTQEFCRDDPERTSQYGYALIAALGRAGEHRAAIRFVLEMNPSEIGEDSNKWLKTAFAQWAEKDPAAALAAVNELPDGGSRFEALESLVATRGRIDPAGVAETLRVLPAGPERNLAFAQALRTWAHQDLKAASNWLDRFEPSPELDAGAEAVATQPGLKHRPEVALSWAASIASPELRSRTVSTLVDQWAQTDAAAALRYARTSPDLLPAERAALLARLTGR